MQSLREFIAYMRLENLKIKPRRGIKRDKSDELSAPTATNSVYSKDFMSDSLTES